MARHAAIDRNQLTLKADVLLEASTFEPVIAAIYSITTELERATKQLTQAVEPLAMVAGQLAVKQP